MSSLLKGGVASLFRPQHKPAAAGHQIAYTTSSRMPLSGRRLLKTPIFAPYHQQSLVLDRICSWLALLS
jgi:hypothetical protein